MGRLLSIVESGFGKADHYSPEELQRYGNVNMNCCEVILRGANEAYALGLRNEDMLLAAPFGGGMGIGNICGAVTGALMVLGILYGERLEKNTPLKEEITKPFLRQVRRRLGGLTCSYNKAHHAVLSPFDCSKVILAVAGCLDEVYESCQKGAADGHQETGK